MAEEWMFVGLGNPGKRYENTRHNMGFMVLKAWVEKKRWNLKEEKRFQGWSDREESDGTKVHLLLPMTYMNESGFSVRRYSDYYRLLPSQMVIITDDVSLPLGEIRLRERGSAGGHNGLKSIERYLGTQEYARLRVGVGFPSKEETGDLADFVLQEFAQNEKTLVEQTVARCVGTLEEICRITLDKVMNQVNRRKPIPDEGQEKQA